MATIFLPTPTLPSYSPSSPDPTPLRMIAFSVAESALQPDPNSPLFITNATFANGNGNGQGGERSLPSSSSETGLKGWDGGGSHGINGGWGGPSLRKPVGLAAKRGQPLWDVVERAKERRALDILPNSLPPSPPISPAAYNFILPSHSPLAAAISASLATSQKANKGPQLSLSPTRFPLYTRSAEPSPTKSTFSTLDQTLPPPEFVPRLSAKEFGDSIPESVVSKLPSRLSQPKTGIKGEAENPTPSRHAAKLPSLAQIQARVRKHRRGGSVGSVPLPRGQQEIASAAEKHMASEDSVEKLNSATPERRDPRDVLRDILNRRPPTPPSPRETERESRLPVFLRTRTLSNQSYPRPEKGMEIRRSSTTSPILHVTPPKSWNPTSSLCLSPPNISPPRRSHSSSSQNSPTLSIQSNLSRRGSASPSSTPSPTLSITVPIITCTPAPVKKVVDGVESDEECETDDLLVFDGGSGWGEGSEDGEVETEEEDERERRGREMRNRLLQRNRS